MKIREHNLETGEIIDREATADELAQHEADKAETATIAQQKAEVEAARQAVLNKLGLTADEIAILLG